MEKIAIYNNNTSGHISMIFGGVGLRASWDDFHILLLCLEYIWILLKERWCASSDEIIKDDKIQETSLYDIT